MGLKITQVDAFTDTAFAGNPAAVCLLLEECDEGWMQKLAREMNLSETAFLRAREDGGFDLRWFTPTIEIDLCGHATLASAHVLWQDGVLAPGDEARFHTRSGVLTARRDGGWIELDFPALPEVAADPPAGLRESLEVSPLYVGKSRFDYLVLVESEDIVRGLRPDFDLLSRVEARGVMVTAAASTPGFDCVSRFFAPASGINEDPVTGSAHCVLGPFWSSRLGKESLLAYQASDRGGVLRVRPSGERVFLGGQAVTVMRAELQL